LDEWALSLVTTARRTARRSVRVATRGISSLTRSPGVRVAMVPKPPRISAGASGLGSNVSCCGGPPTRPETMTAFAFPGRAVAGQREAAEGEAADPQPFAAREAVTQARAGVEEREHGGKLGGAGDVEDSTFGRPGHQVGASSPRFVVSGASHTTTAPTTNTR